MSIVNQMKADRIVARASKDHANFATLTNVIGDFDLQRTEKKNLNKAEDDVILSIIKLAISQAKNASEQYKSLGDRVRQEASEKDVILLEKYLPEAMSEEALVEIAKNIKDSGGKFPDFMKHLKENYKNQYDGSTAATIGKSTF